MFIQVMIILLSGTAILMLNQKSRKLQYWGSLVGLCGQPFWMFSVFTSSPFQWGVAILVCAYTVAYAMGLYNFRKRDSNA